MLLLKDNLKIVVLLSVSKVRANLLANSLRQVLLRSRRKRRFPNGSSNMSPSCRQSKYRKR